MIWSAVVKSLFRRIIVPVRFVLVPFAAMICLARGAFPQPAFEAATIKPVAATRGISSSGVRVYPGGRIAIHALPLKALIVAAYDVGYWQLLGGADWMEKDVYDVEAKPAAQSGTYSLLHSWYGIGDERMRQMLQTERFHLKVHRETTTNTRLSARKKRQEVSAAPHEVHGRPARYGSAWLFRRG